MAYGSRPPRRPKEDQPIVGKNNTGGAGVNLGNSRLIATGREVDISYTELSDLTTKRGPMALFPIYVDITLSR